MKTYGEDSGACELGDTSVPTLSAVATEIRRCLAQSKPDRHESLRWVTQFMVDYARASGDVRPAMVADEPGPTGDRGWDALLAATAEHVCYHHGVKVPRWSMSPERFLATWWFVSPYRSVHASALVGTPAAFANRGVFVHASSLTGV